MANIYSIFSTFVIQLLIWLSCYCMKAKPQILETSLIGIGNFQNSNPIPILGDLATKLPSNPPTIASSEANRRRRKVSAIIVNRWSTLNRYNNIPVDQQQLLEWDAERAKSIQDRFRALRNEVENNGPVRMPTTSGSRIESASFIVYVKIGNEDNIPLIFDTGSKLTWVQCVSCKPCYKQNITRYFDPNASRSRKIECESNQCKTLEDYSHRCTKVNQSCGFEVSYADDSKVFGDFFKDTLSLRNEVVSNDYIFGCANKFIDPTKEKNAFRGSSGMMGLHRGNPVSFIDQTAKKFLNSFSYCLPTRDFEGHLTFRTFQNTKSGLGTTIPMKVNEDKEYMVALVGITVGERRLAIEETVFSEGALIDTGSVRTWLPKSAYDTLQAEYVKQMGKYSRLSGTGNAICYDLTSYPQPQHIPLPRITLHFKTAPSDQAKFEISDKGVMDGPMNRRCLSFAPNAVDDNLSIIGGNAQLTYDFAFNLEKNTIFIGNRGCK